MPSEKVKKLLERLVVLEHQLSLPSTTQNQKQFRLLTQEHAYLSEVKHVSEEIKRLTQEIEDNQELAKGETDLDFIEALQSDTQRIKTRRDELIETLNNLLVPPDPRDDANTILELRAGTGGEEAALFVADCARMYKLYADKKGWNYELLSCTESDMGGFKELVLVFSGKGVYRHLKHEAGTHRVQRVPATEAQGRIHTSAITIAALIEPVEVDFVVDERELRIDTCRSSGAGGQHVNKTDSAVRITHIPSGIQVFCQEERSQHKNKDKAMRLLMAKLEEIEEKKRHAEIASTRAEQVGSGDRSERIRTYNFPQNRVTDHRISLTINNLSGVMEGELDDLSQALIKATHQQNITPPPS